MSGSQDEDETQKREKAFIASIRQEIETTAHRSQYGRRAAEFFKVFNHLTGRRSLYQGYLAGYILHNPIQKEFRRAATDFGCGTGWLAHYLHALGYAPVYGLDKSNHMLLQAFRQANSRLLMDRSLTFRDRIMPDMVGRNSLVTAVHVHYHFANKEQLTNSFFGSISTLLQEGGEAILIGCPSDHLRHTPYHYQNSVHADVLRLDIDPRYLDIHKDKEGYVPLSKLPPEYRLKDGTQMQVTLRAKELDGREHMLKLIDTYWSDEALIEAARETRLEITHRKNLVIDDHPNAYMVMHFTKTGKYVSPGL